MLGLASPGMPKIPEYLIFRLHSTFFGYGLLKCPPEFFAMVETRIAPRVRVMKAAKIEYGGDKYACTVRDLSATGAALDFPDLIRIPDEFTLVLPEDGFKLLCRVVWRREYRVGVTFD
jgi:hypothetical protein